MNYSVAVNSHQADIERGRSKPTPEPDLVQSAYEDQVALLYKELCAGMSAIGGIPSAADEQQCLKRFKTGLILAQRARELALSAFPPPISPVARAIAT